MGLIYPRAACDAPHDPHLPKLSWHGADSLSWRCLSHVVLGLGTAAATWSAALRCWSGPSGHEVQNRSSSCTQRTRTKPRTNHMRSALLQRQNLLRREREREQKHHPTSPDLLGSPASAYKHANERKDTLTHTHTLSLTYTHTILRKPPEHSEGNRYGSDLLFPFIS